MYTISKAFYFSASHQLKQMPTSHPCSRLHGHNYKVEIKLCSQQLNEYGFVVDYLALNELKEYIDKHLDHQHLNDVLGDDCVSAEQIAKYLFDWCQPRWSQTKSITVCESDKTSAKYEP